MSRILLLFEHRENRRLLADTLAVHHDVLDEAMGLEEAFDLCILDGITLDRLWQEVQNRKRKDHPLFLPVLLVCSRADVSVLTRQLWQSVDELITSPIDKLELQARVESLLRSRRLSVQLQARDLELLDRKSDVIGRQYADLVQVHHMLLDDMARRQAAEAERDGLLQEARRSRLALLNILEDERELEEALRESRERLSLLSRQLISAQETERRNLARELHDEIGQVLSAVKMNLNTIKAKGTAPKLLEDCLAIVNRAIGQVRTMSLDLRPAMLDDLGLAPALRWYLDRQAQRAGFTARLADDAGSDQVPGDIATVCFRLVQEAVNNVVRHAQARHVQVELRAADGELELSIRDDGCGFDVALARSKAKGGSSLGLLSMEERVRLAGGEFAMESAAGKGTEIRARFAIPRPASEPVVSYSHAAADRPS